MSANDRLRTPLKNVRGIGAARSGTHHFIVQRVTAVALVPLTLWFVWLALSLMHLDYASARALVGQPWNAVLMIAFIVATFWHAQLGLQVVIEDYVHTRGLEVASQLAVKFLAVLGALACALAVVRIALAS
ncbi:succinate dehydrogenase, hydrophobic membrane anchor protein [Tahibacter soli]|jgi:succinate dehydrogenase / fumarate reductase membrane anchor subunit|uniref:Succinate dehydrogenase hydrophobic membrane anchor subunit n=1 Tax=Tahibacter soli TaxID=2983605 RepID=A0A9X3YIW0_9GAMM|nr:succinate dehydrogenase, hydrophobic membrane anchor protein [Tahibacter soli]MDC8013057.1 succinate dehydrogenase, hydrophobic membrane anchor protein [Tahibacter soli]